MVLIQYIKSSGTQYINTGYAPKANTKVVMSCNIIPYSTNDCPFGTRISAYNNVFLIFARTNGSSQPQATVAFGATYYSIAGSAAALNTDTTLELSASGAKMGEYETTFSGSGITTAYNLFLFNLNQGGASFGAGTACVMKLYSVHIYEADTLVHELLPALDDNNVACLYDSVTNTFLYNSGSGTFEAGDPITPPLGSYTISFNAAGGSGTMADLTATETQPIALTACTFTREGYTFSGWATTPGGPVVYEDQATVTDIAAVGETITLYAVWSAMPFSIVLQYNKSEPIALTKDVETIATLHGVLREDSSIIDPVILIEGDLALFAQANYMTIQRFHRKYFIVDMVSVRSNFIEITAHCDVLSSFAGAIRSNKGIVHRQEKDWNLMLNDGALQVYQDPLIDTIAFPGSFSGQSYVMLIGGSRGGGIAIGSGDGNTGAKTTSGLVAYAQARLDSGYWYGCYGQTADAALFNTMSTLYYVQYTTVDYSDHANQYGQHVQDCVGLIKGYRWSADAASEPVYNAGEDVNVSGLYASCNERHTIASATPIIGSVLFNLTLTHCGVYVGNGKVIEARSHALGVVQTDISDAGRTWTWWGIPSWLTVSTVAG